MYNNCVITKSLTKKYKQFNAVDNVSICVPKGAIYGLIGRNGAGKTTLLKMIAGLSPITSGKLNLFDGNDESFNVDVTRVGCLIETPGLYPQMSAFENLKLKCILCGINDNKYILKLMNSVGLENTNKKVKSYSVGMKQRLGIALALVGKPELLILDEPINGLDPQGIVEVRDIIQKLNQNGMTIIISSHILEELSRITTMIGIIHHGVLVDQLTKSQFESKLNDTLQFITSDMDKLKTFMDSNDIIDYKILKDGGIELSNYSKYHDDIISKMVCMGIDVKSINVIRETLEDYYFSITGDGDR